jgi:F0F1-type ATP synthase epsilon subunit
MIAESAKEAVNAAPLTPEEIAESKKEAEEEAATKAKEDATTQAQEASYIAEMA